MAQGRHTLMDPPIEELLDKVDSKFTLVALGSARARQVNSYYNSLGEGLGKVRAAIHTFESAGALGPSAKNGVDHFHWFIAAMLGLLVVESLLGTRRKQFSVTA